MTSPRTAVGSSPFGRANAPQPIYPLQGDDGTTETDYSQEVAHTFTATVPVTGAAVDITTTHTVYHSRRTGTIQRWHTTFPDLSGTAHTWLRRVDLGQGFLPNERYFEEFQTGGERQHNPTMAASILRPPAAANARCVPSPVVYFAAENRGDSARFEGCTIPLDYDSFGEEHPQNDRGGDWEHHLLWWRHRQFQRVDACFGHPRIHRVQHWFYAPRAWYSQIGGPWMGWAFAGAALTDYFGTTYSARFYDPVTRIATDLGADWTGQTSQSYRATGDRASPGLDLFSVINRTDPYPFSTEYAAAILPGRNGADDVCIATYGKVAKGSPNAGDGCRRPSRLILIQQRNAPFTVDEDFSSGSQFGWYSPSPLRADGWCCVQFFIITASSLSDGQALVDLAHRRRLADAEPLFTVPSAVIDGMDPSLENRFGPRG